MLYRRYVTDSLFLSGTNERLSIKYDDLLNRVTKKVEIRSGDEIAEDIIKKHGLKAKGGTPS